MFDYNDWKLFEQIIISNKKPQKPKLELLNKYNNGYSFLTENKKIVLNLVLDHNTAYSWNQLKNKKLSYSTNCIDVTKISYGVYGICHPYINPINFDRMFLQDRKDQDYKSDPKNWLEYQINFICKLDEINRDNYLRKIKFYNTETGKFLIQVWENYTELVKNKLIINKIELSDIGINSYNKYMLYKLNGQILTPNKMTEFILDPYPEVILQFGINPVFGGTNEVTKNIYRLSRLYYQYLLNTKKIKS
jgi:hypothetical protein